MIDYQDTYRNKKVLITGGLGFIGSNLAMRLVELGARVTVVDALIWAYGGNLFNIEPVKDKVRVIVADIRDRMKMDDLVRGQDYIFNLAGQVSHIDSMTDPFTDMDINVRSQMFLLEACRQNNPGVKIVYTSSRQVYGKPQKLPVPETHPVAPVDVNGINIVAAEWYHILYNNVYGLRAVTLRLTNVYGPRQLIKHNRQGFIGWFVRQAVEGNKILLYGDGSQKRDLNYVDDVVEALLLAGADDASDGHTYNLGHNEVVSLKGLTERLISLAGSGSYELVPWPPEKKRIDIGDYYGDFSKIKRAVGWSPQIDLAEGLRRTVAYYQKYLKNYL